MKILHVYRTYFPDTHGGLEETVRQICRNTVLHGVESRVFCLSPQPNPSVIEFDGVQVYRAQRTFEVASCGFSISGLGLFMKLVEWADIVHYHFPWPFADMLHLMGRVNKPSVMTYHSDIVRQKGLLKVYGPLMHRFLEKMNIIVATSPNYLETSDVLKCYANKVEIIPIGIDSSSCPHANRSVLQKMKQQAGEDFFLFVGVLRYYKGLHFLLEAVKNTDLSVVIAGSGPMKEKLIDYAQKLDLDNVLFSGYISNAEKASLIELSRAMVFPSHLRSEAFGVTLVEGAMYGKPLISCEIGTGTSYVNTRETGFVLPPGNSNQLCNAMKQLSHNSALAEKMGKAARERYERLFTGRQMGERYAQQYQKLVTNAGISPCRKSTRFKRN